MYARSIVDSRLEIAQDELGFLLEYHSPSEVDLFNERLESRYQDAYSSARAAGRGSGDSTSAYQNSLIRSLSEKLTSEEIRFIKNERALCMCDAEYWLSNYYRIKTQSGMRRFSFRDGQRVYFNVVQKLQERGAPIELIMAKSRQLGISTITEGLIVHAVNFGDSINAVVASADEGKTAEMSKMTFLGYDEMPWWLKVPYKRRVESNRGMLTLETKSSISFQHGAQLSGIGRGSTFAKYHLSEVASFNNPSELIEAALFECVHPHPDVFGVLESTAEGNSGWFYDTYTESKRARAAGEYSRLTAKFLPWTVAPDQFPEDKTWLRLNPVPRDWRPIDETMAMMNRAEAYIQSDEDLRDVLGQKWTISMPQAWWWECRFLEARARGTQKIFLQEQPCDDRECFQSSYENVFGREVIAAVDSRRETKYCVFGIVGQSIEDEPHEEDRDHTMNPVQVRFVNRIRDVAYKWELQPLLWQEPFNAIDEIRSGDEDHMNKLFVYREPERGYDYSIGIRTGNGIGSGDTVVAVARRGIDPQDPDEQVAEFRSGTISHVEVYAYALAIAAYYSKFMGMPEYQMKYKQPYVSMEQVESVGDSCLVQMRRMGYRRFHRMVRYDGANISKAQATRLGWYSFSWATPMMTDSFVVRVQRGWYKVNSPYTIWECDHWEQRAVGAGGVKTKYIASETSSDAGLLANAMAAFCPNDVEALADRTTKRSVEGLKGKPVFDFTPTPDGLVIPVTSSYTAPIDEYRLFGNARNR